MRPLVDRASRAATLVGWALCALAASATSANSPDVATRVDPHFREALFHAHQGDHFSALERLDAELAQHYGVDERPLDSLYDHIGEAEFSVGDFELRYRMHRRAGRAIRAVLEGDVDEATRAEAAYRLARLHAQKGQPAEALHVLDRMPTPATEALGEDATFLRANVLLALGKPKEAVKALRTLDGSDQLEGFVDFNLAIALLRAGEVEEAIRRLDRAGRIGSDDRDRQAIRDKANLLLGTLLFEAERFGYAQRSFDRVRLTGPFSNHALLRAGWSEVSSEAFDRAVVPWSILVERDSTDAAVQEALLALPFAYSKLDVHGRAAVLYQQAAVTFGSEIEKLDASITSVEEGHFLRALEREEIRRDADWVVRLRALPDAPETHYLISLMASHEFQTALQNYLDLADMHRKLAAWRRSLGAFDEVIALRRSYHEPRLPDFDARFRKLDAQMRVRLEQARHVRERLQKMLTTPSPSMLATAEELQIHDRLEVLADAVERIPSEDAEPLKTRMRRLRGVIAWRIETNYHARLTDVHADLTELNDDLELLSSRYESYVRARQAASHSYVGYSGEIASLRARITRSETRLETLLERQGEALERVARSALVARRERLRAYQNKARFAFADSYDRASKSAAR